jgi:hypothetical protein
LLIEFSQVQTTLQIHPFIKSVSKFKDKILFSYSLNLRINENLSKFSYSSDPLAYQNPFKIHKTNYSSDLSAYYRLVNYFSNKNYSSDSLDSISNYSSLKLELLFRTTLQIYLSIYHFSRQTFHQIHPLKIIFKDKLLFRSIYKSLFKIQR